MRKRLLQIYRRVPALASPDHAPWTEGDFVFDDMAVYRDSLTAESGDTDRLALNWENPKSGAYDGLFQTGATMWIFQHTIGPMDRLWASNQGLIVEPDASEKGILEALASAMQSLFPAVAKPIGVRFLIHSEDWLEDAPNQESRVFLFPCLDHSNGQEIRSAETDEQLWTRWDDETYAMVALWKNVVRHILTTDQEMTR